MAAALVAAGLAVPLAVGAATAAPASASTPKCAMAGLDAWLGPSEDGTAGTIYYVIELTNFSGHACTVQGYVTAVGTDFSGHVLGSPASRSGGASPLVTLVAGASATAALGIREAGNFPAASCHQTTAAGVRVALPGATTSRVIPYVFDACSRVGPDYLTVAPLRSS